MLDRQRSTKEVLLIASAEYAINNTSFVDLCLSSIVASYHFLSDLVHTSYTYIMHVTGPAHETRYRSVQVDHTNKSYNWKDLADGFRCCNMARWEHVWLRV